MAGPADRNLLFGILALQLDFISREQLIGGMQAWVLAKEKSLGDVLQAAGNLSADDRNTLEAVVVRHLQKHHDDPEQSLATLSSVGSIQQALHRLADPHLEASLPLVGSARQSDSFATTAQEPTNATRFQILRPHAEGGLGKVFVARDGELNREVALKEIQPHYAHDGLARARFTVEAEITGRLEHPGIVPVYGLGAYADGRPYYAMRFIRGESLKEAINRYHDPERAKQSTASERAVELHQLLGRFIDVCQAVQYAHDRGVLHRDLKPANVMLGKYGETLVVDWGLAKAEGKSVVEAPHHDESQLVPASGSAVEPTQMGTMVGTLQYMSPEQAIGRMDLVGPATDVFALGATLYHLLTGQAPYQSKSRDELIAAVRDARFPPPRQILHSTPVALEAICLKALAADPAARYTSPGELLKDVERWLAEEPVSAHPETLAEQSKRWQRKNPKLVGGVKAAIAIAIVGLCIGASFMRDMNGRLAQANRELEQACRRAYEGMVAANEERERNRQTMRFLSTALGNLQTGEDGRQISAATLLARATDQADAEFDHDPELKSRILEILTTALGGLGLTDEAIAGLQRKLAETRRHCPASDPRAIDCVNDLARAYLAAGRSAEAIQVLEQHAAAPTVTQVRHRAPVHPSPSNLSTNQGGGTDGLSLLDSELLRHHAEKHEGLDIDDPLVMLDRHATTHLAKGQWDQAITVKEAAVRIATATRGRKSQPTASRLLELALLYEHAGRAQPAIPLSEEAWQLETELHGPDSRLTWQAMDTVGNAYRLAGRLSEAIPLLEKATRLLAAQEPNSPATLEGQGILALAYRDANRLAEAHTLAAAVHEKCQKVDGPAQRLSMQSAFHLATILVLQDKTAEAIQLCEQTIENQTNRLGDDHPDTLATQLWLGRAHTRAQDFEAAEALLLRLQEKIAEAPLGTRWQCQADCLQFLAELYTAWEQPDEAEKWRSQLAAWKQDAT